MSKSGRSVLLWAFLLGVASLAVVIGSLRIDQTANSYAEARHLGFGYPVHFVWGDYTRFHEVPPFESRFNPWEFPSEGDRGAFALSWILVYGALLCLVLAVRTVLRHRARRLDPVLPASI